ncbi:GNAT family N-acetyltransferase [Amycolatopsis xylanica]|uniref:GNAT family N-acetyltransferase n=1 Tax=Amycolatopsis xylanica TaxID=589385 RepID=UPI0015A33D72|nr:GNAT family N-acetyltransferase [Amycolatopsis xylanica]
MGWFRRRRCPASAHRFRVGTLVFRTPTELDSLVAVAGASDDEAQRWLGWELDHIVLEPHRDRYLAMAPGRGTAYDLREDAIDLIAIHPRRKRCAGLVSVHSDGELGGWLMPGFRGQGLGGELFKAGLVLAHEHLGLTSVRAGVETTNLASQGALRAAGMRQVDGPPTHTLPNGRVMSSYWFQHEVAQPRRCS